MEKNISAGLHLYRHLMNVLRCSEVRSICQHNCCDGRNCIEWADEQFRKFAAYEDTGFSPGEIDRLCREMSDIRLSVGIKTFERMKHAVELLEVEDDGRLIILPCNIGDTVYSWYLDCKKPYRRGNCTDWRTDEDIEKGVSCEKCPHRYPVALARPFRWADIPLFGKSVFLTPEEAEKVMKNSAGFYGYDWMIDSLIQDGYIHTRSESKKEV